VLIIGCDYHPSMQQISWVHTDSGEYGEQRLAHCTEAEEFYRGLKQQGVDVRVGMEATGIRVGSSACWPS
jgi:transposase